MNRKFIIEDLYELWADGESLDLEQKVDPFWDPVEDVFLGGTLIKWVFQSTLNRNCLST